MRVGPRRTVLALAGLAAAFGVVAGIQFDVAHNGEECFFDDIHTGTSVSVGFAVVSGGTRLIDVDVKDPHGKAIYADKSVGEGKLSFTAKMDGKYATCFSNRMGHSGVKSIKMALDTTEEEPEIQALIKKGAVNRATSTLNELLHLTRRITYQQNMNRYMSDRHNATLKSTNFRVRTWSFIEVLSVVGVSAFQIVFLKRTFSKQQNQKGRMV